MTTLPDPFDDGINSAAAMIAVRAEADPSVADTAIIGLIEAYGWELRDRPDGTSLWRHPTAGTVDRRVDALAWSLAAARRQAGGWPRFCESCWRN